MHNFINNLKKNTRFLPSIFLSIILTGIINQIYIVNNLPQLLTIITNQNQEYQQKLTLAITEKQQLQEQLNLIIHNTDVLESKARLQLGLVKSGEKFYYFPK